MFKSKYMLSALAFLVVMTMSTSAFAQVGIFNVFNSPASRGRMNGYAEASGRINFVGQTAALLENGATAAETITISYGARIDNELAAGTNPIATDNPTAIAVTICDDAAVGAGSLVDTSDTESDAKVSVSSTRLTIRLEGSNCDADNNLISVSGVRLTLAGEGLDSVTARVSSGGGVVLVGDTSFDVIESVVDELTDDGVEVPRGGKVTLIRHTGEPDVDYFVLHLYENTVDSFADSKIELEFLGIPDHDDVELTVDAWVITEEDLDDNVPAAVDSKQLPIDGGRTVDLNADAYEAVVDLTTAARIAVVLDDGSTDDVDESRDAGGILAPRDVDVVIIRGSISGTDEDDLLPLGDIDIRVVANVGPVGSRSGSAGETRFASDPTEPVTIIEAAPDRETITITLAISNGTYDTGIAVINTGRLTGPLTFTFSNMDGTETDYTTSASSPGQGLNSSGMLAPGGTYLVLLSEMMESAFSGYIEIETDFTGALGTGYISDFRTVGFSSSVENP